MEMGAAEVGCACTQLARQARTHVCGASVADVGRGRTCSCGRAQGVGAERRSTGPGVLPVSRKRPSPGTWPSTTSSRVNQGRKLEIVAEEDSFQHQMRVTLIGKNPCWHNQVPGRDGWMDGHPPTEARASLSVLLPRHGPGPVRHRGLGAAPRGRRGRCRERVCVCVRRLATRTRLATPERGGDRTIFTAEPVDFRPGDMISVGRPHAAPMVEPTTRTTRPYQIMFHHSNWPFCARRLPGAAPARPTHLPSVEYIGAWTRGRRHVLLSHVAVATSMS
jgi:hypothetical protein